jgi:hypothetical protein
VCDAVRFYHHWVNGEQLRLVQLAAGRMPAAGPQPPSPALEGAGTPIELDLDAHDGDPVALPALDRQALQPVSHVLLHGSMATRDGCNFSDVDIAVFVDDLRSYPIDAHHAAIAELRRLLRAVFECDALMHHGLMFAGTSSLRKYDEQFLPVAALRCARVLHGPRRLRISLADAPPERFRETLRRTAQSLRRHFADRDFLDNDYRLKSVLSGSLLMPARVLAAKGEHVYKRESFALARELFARNEWEFIARCEGLRALWVRPPAPVLGRGVPAKSHPYLRQIVDARMAPRLNVQRLSRKMIDGLTHTAHAFLDRVEAIA